MNWYNAANMESRGYTCGHCGNQLASNQGYYATDPGGGVMEAFIYICHQCEKPTHFAKDGSQNPGAAFGNPVSNIPAKEVEDLYEEARNCMKVNAHTAAVMCCRKLLMNVAVSEGADTGKGFVYYVKYLAGEGHIPPKATVWVDHIRDKGNDANHEIRIMSREDAERLIRFSEMMLRIMYEYPAEVKDPVQAAVQQTGPQTVGGGSNPPT